MHPIILLIMLTISAKDGSEVSRKFEAGPFETIEQCNAAQQKTGIQKPEGDTITVHQCAAVAAGQERAG